MAELPATDKLRPRPVWKRRLLRTMRNTEAMPPPTDEEKHDAICVLKHELFINVALLDEAQRILDESCE